ncbi:TonB-dependent siderophore receptor [uncultured Gilvimarinus sp.]|uniref:TonB-dependent siderophore receptor n=1 Tax=uncultured Gilvimarinus sp. TaxID=1689143 RepID=UPI0030ED8D78
MRRQLQRLPLAALLAASAAQPVIAQNNDKPVQIEVVNVYGEPEKSSTATKLDLSVYETPQTVTVISRTQIDDFALDNINDLLRYTPGVTVESVETDRTYFTARGFDIVNFQYDGVGVPFSAGLSQGHQDTAVFEQVEVVKGAAGLITGLANPSATINYIRKRPTADFGGYLSLQAGPESSYRLEGDISGAISDRIRARLVMAKDDAESYLDRNENDNSVFYGVIEGDITDSTLLTLGYSQNQNDIRGSLSGALPMHYTDGSATDYDVGTSTAPDWAFRDIERRQTFVELRQQLGANWTLNAHYTQNDIEQDSELFYVYGTPERETEIGLLGYASGYRADEKQKVLDVFVNGTFALLGQEHDLVFGYNKADIDLVGQSLYDHVNGYPVLGSDWAEGNTPRPDLQVYDTYTDGSQDNQEHESLYFATRLKLLDSLSVLLGARQMEVTQGGYSYGVSADTYADETVPYYGFTWAFLDNVSLYASYSEVFTPQSFVTPEFQPLGVAQGDNSEVGLKVQLNDGQATGTLAFFQSEQSNLGEYVGRVDGVNTYLGKTYDSEGAELELSGAVTDNLNMSFGYTWVDITDTAGTEVRTYVPRNLVKLAAAYQLPMLPPLVVGASVNWQDTVSTTSDAGVPVSQSSYALLDVFARYQLTEDVSLALNVSNLTDEKYWNSLYWTQAYYGAPLQASASVSWSF